MKLIIILLFCTYGIESVYSRGAVIIESISKENLQAVYKDLQSGEGVKISSTLDSLYIESLQGQTLVSAEKIQGSLGIAVILGNAFLRVTGKDIAVPLGIANRAKRVADRQGLMFIHELLIDVPQHESSEELRNAVKSLLELHESNLIKEASFALGKKGITGTQYPCVLVFFKFALALEEVKHSEWNKNMMIKKQWPTYSNSSDDCLEECPPCPDDACLGMCGFGCLCWKFICGDCCYHLGCYGHDMCCRQNFFDTQCLFPYGFVCDGDYYCNI